MKRKRHKSFDSYEKAGEAVAALPPGTSYAERFRVAWANLGGPSPTTTGGESRFELPVLPNFWETLDSRYPDLAKIIRTGVRVHRGPLEDPDRGQVAEKEKQLETARELARRGHSIPEIIDLTTISRTKLYKRGVHRLRPKIRPKIST